MPELQAPIYGGQSAWGEDGLVVFLESDASVERRGGDAER